MQSTITGGSVMSVVSRCMLGKQLIDCTTENRMRHDETVFSLRSCQLFIAFSGRRRKTRADKLMTYSLTEDTGAQLAASNTAPCSNTPPWSSVLPGRSSPHPALTPWRPQQLLTLDPLRQQARRLVSNGPTTIPPAPGWTRHVRLPTTKF